MKRTPRVSYVDDGTGLLRVIHLPATASVSRIESPAQTSEPEEITYDACKAVVIAIGLFAGLLLGSLIAATALYLSHR